MPGPKGTGQRWRDAQHGCFLPVFPTTHRLWVDRRQPLLRRAKDHEPLGMGMRMRGDMDHHHHQRQRPSPPRARRQSAPSSQAPSRLRKRPLVRHCGSHNAPGQARRGFPGCSHKQATPRSIRCLASVEPSSSASRLLQRQSIPALGSTFSLGHAGGVTSRPPVSSASGLGSGFGASPPRAPPSAPATPPQLRFPPLHRQRFTRSQTRHRRRRCSRAAMPTRKPQVPSALLGALPSPPPRLAPLVGGAARS